MSLTRAIMPSLRDRHLASETAEVKAVKKVKKGKVVPLGGKKSETKKKGKS